MRTLSAITLLALIACTARAAEPAGGWKLGMPIDQGKELTFLIALAEKDGKWTADITGMSAKLKAAPKVTNVAVAGDHVKFGIEIDGREILTFDGLLSKDKKKISGSIAALGGRLFPTEMRPTKLKNLDDSFEVAREMLAQMEVGPEMFELSLDILSVATLKKIPADEVKGIVERLNKAAGAFGPRWERDVTLKLTTALSGQEGFTDLALAQARRAERMLSDTDDAATRITVLDALAKTLTKGGKADEAKPYLAQVTKLEARDYAEYAKTHPPFKADTFAGRKAKSDRTVFVEVFTGAECPPCAAVDLAFDGLMKTYKPTEVVMVQYHCHIPAPDPLTSPDGEARLNYYEKQITGAPTVFVAGAVGPPGGGPAPASEKKYKALRTPIDEALEKPAGVKLGLAVAKADKGFSIKATVDDLATPGEKMSLRFILAEERVRYAGGNGIRFHHMVVRAMPGGAKGFPLTKKSHAETVTVDTDAVKAALLKYLDDTAKTEGEFPRPDRPLALKNLKVIAFVQNDTTKEILHAAQVDLDAK